MNDKILFLLSGPIQFVLCAVNIPFIVQDPTRWMNWASAVICFGMGIVASRG